MTDFIRIDLKDADVCLHSYVENQKEFLIPFNKINYLVSSDEKTRIDTDEVSITIKVGGDEIDDYIAKNQVSY